MASPKLRAFRSKLIYVALLGLSAIVRLLPLRLLRYLGIALGELGWLLLIRQRRLAVANITVAFPDWPQRKRAATIRRMFHHLGQSLLEVLWLPNVNAEVIARTTTFEGIEPVFEQVRAGRGIVSFTAHCGNWEWMAYCLTKLGIPMSVLQREREEAQMNEFITRLRATAGIRTINRGSTAAARELIFAIRRGGMIGFLIDQSIRVESVRVPFFGRPALTPVGPAKLAIRTGAPVVSVFVERRDGKHHVRFTEILESRDNDDPIALTALITQDIEEQIRRAPEQWVWMHDRWRERPEWDVTAETGSSR